MNNANKIDVEKSRRCGLLRLQKEYLENTLKKLDETIELSVQLDSFENLELIRLYLDEITKLEEEVDRLYAIACDIEKSIK